MAGREPATGALLEAIRRGNLDETREALAAGADPGASEPYQVVIDRSVCDGSWTPPFLAVSRGKHDTARILLCGGADPNLTDRGGREALTLARAGEHASVAQLIENGPPY